MDETAIWLALILVPALILGFYCRFWWAALYVIVFALFVARAELRNALVEGPNRKEAEALVWLSLMVNGLFGAIAWTIGRAAAFVWSRIGFSVDS